MRPNGWTHVRPFFIPYTYRMGFNEGKFLQGIDDRRKHKRESDLNAVREAGDLPEVIHQAHERLLKYVFPNPNYAVQAPEFISVYGEQAVMNDMREVLEIRKRHDGKRTPQDRKAKILAETFEGMPHDEGVGFAHEVGLPSRREFDGGDQGSTGRGYA